MALIGTVRVFEHKTKLINQSLFIFTEKAVASESPMK